MLENGSAGLETEEDDDAATNGSFDEVGKDGLGGGAMVAAVDDDDGGGGRMGT